MLNSVLNARTLQQTGSRGSSLLLFYSTKHYFASEVASPSTDNNKQNKSNEVSTGGGGGAPYRPWPLNGYTWSKAAEFWLNKYPAQSEKSDEYKKEELYLHEIEERLRSYDVKFSHSDRIKELYNEYAWENSDDRAYHTYGGGLNHSQMQYGPGKKIDINHYINPDFVAVDRKAFPPIQYMTAEQIRRSRGSLANYRELPPETPSIFKYWNGYSCLGVFFTIMVTKEFWTVTGHDFYDAQLVWGFFGFMGAFAADWLSWWNTLIMQESFDKEYFPLLENVKALNEQLNKLNNKPSEKSLLLAMAKYRENVSEKVLQKTLSNRLQRIVDATHKKLEDKISEEKSVVSNAEQVWKKEALEKTLTFYEQQDIRNDFTEKALDQFTEDGVASLSNLSTSMFVSKEFKEVFGNNLNEAKTRYISDHKQKGSLNWVFRDKSEKNNAFMSNDEKLNEYKQRIKNWEDKHNKIQNSSHPFA